MKTGISSPKSVETLVFNGVLLLVTGGFFSLFLFWFVVTNHPLKRAGFEDRTFGTAGYECDGAQCHGKLLG